MAIGGEVSVPHETPNDIIAAVALYNLTFYGFSPDERRSQLNKWFGKPTDGEPQEEDLLTDETKSLEPDPIELSDDEYDKQYDIYGEAVLKDLRELAQNGDKYGQFYLGRVYDQGLYGLNRDKAEAFRLYQESAAKTTSRLRTTSLNAMSMVGELPKTSRKPKNSMQKHPRLPIRRAIPKKT